MSLPQTIVPLIRHAQRVASLCGSESLRIVRGISSFKVQRNDGKRPSALHSAGTLGILGGPSTSLLSASLHPLLPHSLRTICGRENCADPCKFPRCSPENLKKSSCMKKKKKKGKKGKKGAKKSIYEVYWNRPECCNDACMNAFPRFDDLYYRESDKAKRRYTQTWASCPRMVVKPRPICCTDKVKMPPLCKRKRGKRPKTACNPKDKKCKNDSGSKCPRIRMPCCAAARTAPCKIEKFPSGCKKFKAPSPSFSECRKPDQRRRRANECWCLASPSMCRVWSEWRRLQKIKSR